VHRVSQRGNRRLNHALHLAAICQIRQPHSEGRRTFERTLAEGKTNKNNAVHRQLVTESSTWPGQSHGGPGPSVGGSCGSSHQKKKR
jgi:hypothetical protein